MFSMMTDVLKKHKREFNILLVSIALVLGCVFWYLLGVLTGFILS